MERVSIVIPCYNQARYLDQAIESALAQTIPPFEIIVVDDGSADATREIAARYAGRVRYLYQENRGLSGARNSGARGASGEYISFLDADDLLAPTFLATLLPLLAADKSAGAAYGGCAFVDEQGRGLPQTTSRVVPPAQVHDALVEGDFFPAHAVLLRRSVLEAVGPFDETLPANEDWDMWLRVSSVSRMVGTDIPVAFYRIHGENMTRDLERMHASHLAVARKHFGPEEGDPSSGWPRDRSRAYAAIYIARALAHLRRGESEAATEYLRHALVISPLLSSRLDVFYALGCGDQPLGRMGDLSTLNLEQNAVRLQRALEEIFDVEAPLALKAKRREAFGTAWFALGLLAYGSGRVKQALGWLGRAAVEQPDLLVNHQFTVTLFKALVKSQLPGVRRWKHARSPGD